MSAQEWAASAIAAAALAYLVVRARRKGLEDDGEGEGCASCGHAARPKPSTIEAPETRRPRDAGAALGPSREDAGSNSAPTSPAPSRSHSINGP